MAHAISSFVQRRRRVADAVFRVMRWPFPHTGKAQLKAPAVTWRTEVATPEFPLILTTGRLRDQWHTMTKTGRVQKLNGHVPTPAVEIHPADAAARGLSDGAIVTVRTVRGTVRVRAEVTPRIKAGSIFLPMHWGRLQGGVDGRINSTTNPAFDPVSKEPDLKFSAVDVIPYVPTAQKIVIIGGGAATWGFLEHHLAAGLRDTVQVFGDEPLPFYDLVQLPHLVDGTKAWDQLVKGDRGTWHERSDGRYTFTPGCAITGIDRKAKEIVDATGMRHAYDLLIIATGSRAAKVYQGPMPQSGVHFLRKTSDAEAIRSLSGSGKRALVVSGDLLGLELADALVEIGTDVIVLQRSERLMGRQLDAKGGAATAVDGELVCSCNRIGANTITKAIAEGCSTLSAVCTKTAAGTSCGSCRPEVAQLLAAHATRLPPTRRTVLLTSLGEPAQSI